MHDIRELENMDLISDDLSGNLYLMNGAITKFQDTGEFMRSELPKKIEIKEDDSDGWNDEQSKEQNEKILELNWYW